MPPHPLYKAQRGTMPPRPLHKTGDLVFWSAPSSTALDEPLIIINVLGYNISVHDNVYNCWSLKRSNMFLLMERHIRLVDT
jgi:hypothetical protein